MILVLRCFNLVGVIARLSSVKRGRSNVIFAISVIFNNMKSLPDYLEHKLRIVSVGLNPSPISVNAGYYFANPRNRFWKALINSKLLQEDIEPGKAAMQELFKKYRIGFTDLVKRSTRMGNELHAADYRKWSPVLKEKLIKFQPNIAWFHGKGTYQNYLKYAEGKKINFRWGAQSYRIGKTRVFVTPNPSPANAKFSLDDLIKSYNRLAKYIK